MARFAFMIVAVVMAISATRSVDSAPIDEMYYPRFNPDRDNYKDDRVIRSVSSALPTNGNPEIVTEVVKEVDLKVRVGNPSVLIESHGMELPKPSSDKVRRAAYWYPYWTNQGFWTPSPTEGSHFVYDSFLGKVRREAPNAPSRITTPSYPQMADSKQTH